MRNRFNLALLWSFLLVLSAAPIMAQTVYSQTTLERLAKGLSGVKLPSRDSVFSVPAEICPRSLVVRYDSHHRVSHLGVSLFKARTDDQSNNVLFSFTERFLLDVLIQEKAGRGSAKLKEWHCSMTFNGSDYGSSAFSSLKKVLGNMKAPIDYALKKGDKKAMMQWNWGKGQQLSLEFPLNRELVEGSNMEEADRALYMKIQAAGDKANFHMKEPVTELDLMDQQYSLYISPGTSMPTNKALNNNRYYILKGTEYKMAFTSAYAFYSLTNLFLGSLEARRVDLKLTHMQYGKAHPTLKVPAATFYELFSPDFDIYCNAGKDKKGNLEIYVVFSHKHLNYLHLLQATISEKELFQADKPVLQGTFYSYTPIDNMKEIIK